MIHIATIHWRKDAWIDLQISMFEKHIHAPFRVYGYLTGIDPAYYARFHEILDAPDGGHAYKLNTLAERILSVASDEDWLMFIDGDAFPVDDLVRRLAPMLEATPLVAIRRLENLSEKHPHPSFCATTVGFWRNIKANWNPGFRWINALNLTETDVGGELLGKLTRTNIEWTPLLRTNPSDVLPVYFGIYGDLVYHHGAGFRSLPVRQMLYDEGLYKVYRRPDARLLSLITPRKHLKKVRDSWIHPEGRKKKRIVQRVQQINEHMTSGLFSDPAGYLRLLRAGDIDQLLE